jgi:Flp pilus assembly protein TadD
MAQSHASQFSGIFVSYRRDDSSGHAGRLFDNLAKHFGEDQIFMDIDTIEPGEDFVTVIENAVGSCEILIVIIGRHWLSQPGESTRRLDNPNDFVRLEIATALDRNIRVIPVLVQRASMPKPEDLPDDLARLTRRNAIELSDVRWQNDVERLIGVMERVLAKPDSARLAETRRKVEADSHGEKEKQYYAADEGASQIRPAPFPGPKVSAEETSSVRRDRSKRAMVLATIAGIGIVFAILALNWSGLMSRSVPEASRPADLESTASENHKRGQEFFSQKKFAEAEPYYREAVRLEPDSAAYQNDLCTALFGQQKYAQAEPFCREAVRLAPTNDVMQNNLGDALFAQQRYADAETQYREAVRLAPGNAQHQNDLCTSLYGQQKYVQAEPFCREAVRLTPNEAVMRNNLGDVLYEQQKYMDARTEYQEAVRLDPGNKSFQEDLNRTAGYGR